MADFSALKQSIQNYIKQNGNKEITGAILQNILLSMVTTMGDGAINDNASDISNLNSDLSDEINRAKGAETTTVLFSDGKLVFKNAAGTVLYQLSVDSFLSAITTRLNTGALYAGYATPSTTPAALTSQDVFYLATQAGTYNNFHFNGGDDPIVLTKDGIYFIISGTDDDDWNAEPMLQLDDVPTASSNNAVKSGGVAEELALGAIYDVSAKNPTAGPNNDGKWESLSALLLDANLNTLIPTSVRKGGMSVKFVSSVDNKYVQYRLMSDSFNTTPSNWQGVDEEPTAGSENLVKSGGVFDYISLDNNLSSAYEHNARITDGGSWQVAPNNKCYLIPTKILDRIIVNRKSGVSAKYAYVESLPVNGQAASFYGSTGLVDIDGPNKDVEITVNKLAKYFYIVLLNVGTEILNSCLFNRFAYEDKTDSIIAENVPKVNTLYASTSNYMIGQFAGLFSHFKVSNPNRQYYLRKFTASQLTIGYIDGNNCYAAFDIPYTIGNIAKVYNGYEYIECVVANTNGLTPESASVTDITNARKRVIYGKAFKPVVRLNNSSFVDILIDNLYIDKPIQNGVLYVRHLRMSSANNYINIGIYKDNSLYGSVDVYLTKKSQTVSIGVWNISIELSDIAISGYFGVMSDIMSIDNSITYFNADVITNAANFTSLYEASKKAAIEPLFTYDDNLTGTEMMQRMLNSRLFEKQMVNNVICEFEGGSDSTSCYHDDYFYTATVEGTTNDVFWGTGCKTVLYINNKSDGGLVSRTIIAEENKQVTIGGSTITMQRGASMPNLVITNDGLCVLFCTMVNNVFVLMRCLVDLSDNTIISYSICTINGEQLNTTQIKNLGGVYSDMTREFSININGNFRDAKDDNGYWYVGVTGAYALKYPMIMKTNDFEAFTFVTFITADSMNAAYECSTGFYKVANTPYLYTATRQSELLKGGNSFIMVNVINLSTNKVEQTRMISGADSRPCIFAHRNGHLILAYSLPGYRMRTRLVWLTRPDVQSLIQDGTFMNCGYFNFFKDDNAPQYYCVVALAASNLTNSQYLTSCQIGEYSLDSARNIIDNLVL